MYRRCPGLGCLGPAIDPGWIPLFPSGFVQTGSAGVFLGTKTRAIGFVWGSPAQYDESSGKHPAQYMTSFDNDIVSGSVVRSVLKLALPIIMTMTQGTPPAAAQGTQ